MPVVFIQGAGIQGDAWLPQTDALKFGCRFVSFDNRGMGRSQPAGIPITVEAMAADTIAIMDEAGISDAHLVGHSLGGAVALHLGFTHRTRVRSLALLCTSGRGADALRLSRKLLWVGMRTRVGTAAMRRRAFAELVLSPAGIAATGEDAAAERLAPIVGHDLAEQPPVVEEQLAALRNFDASRRLRELAGMPTLVGSATEDIIFPPRFGQALAAGIPGARFVEFPGAHAVPIEFPDLVNSALLEHFLAAEALSGARD